MKLGNPVIDLACVLQGFLKERLRLNQITSEERAKASIHQHHVKPVDVGRFPAKANAFGRHGFHRGELTCEEGVKGLSLKQTQGGFGVMERNGDLLRLIE